jgi:hypothetical protein
MGKFQNYKVIRGLTMKYKILIILIVIIGIMAQGINANTSIQQSFTQQYDNQGTNLDKCTTCMSSTSPADWNTYGTDLRNDPDFDRNNPTQAFMNIEQMDSDGDGFSNIDEISNSTLPGDPEDFPAIPMVTQSPSPTLIMEQTEEATQMPTAAQTEEEPTTNSIFSALITLVTIVVVSILVKRKKE